MKWRWDGKVRTIKLRFLLLDNMQKLDEIHSDMKNTSYMKNMPILHAVPMKNNPWMPYKRITGSTKCGMPGIRSENNVHEGQ